MTDHQPRWLLHISTYSPIRWETSLASTNIRHLNRCITPTSPLNLEYSAATMTWLSRQQHTRHACKDQAHVAQVKMLGTSSFTAIDSSFVLQSHGIWNQLMTCQAPYPHDPDMSNLISHLVTDWRGGWEDMPFQLFNDSTHHTMSAWHPLLRCTNLSFCGLFSLLWSVSLNLQRKERPGLTTIASTIGVMIHRQQAWECDIDRRQQAWECDNRQTASLRVW